MIFDKNREIFENEVYKKIWEAAVMMSPIEKSTSFISDAELKSSCIDWYNYKTAVYSDMYENPDVYLLTSELNVTDYNKFLLNLFKAGKISRDNSFTIDLRCLRVHTEKIYQPLSRQGMKFIIDGDRMKVSNFMFPRMFYAGEKLFEAVQQYKNNGGEQAKYLTYCDFRALQKGYKRGFDIMTESLSSERMSAARKIHELATENKIRQVKRLYFNNLRYDYKSAHILHLFIHNNKFTLSLEMGNSYDILCDEIKKRDNSGDLISYFYKNIRRCTACGGVKKNPKAICGKYYDLGGESVYICNPMIYVLFEHFTETDMPYFTRLLDVRLELINAGIK